MRAAAFVASLLITRCSIGPSVDAPGSDPQRAAGGAIVAM
jgi:hypothetical protein